MEKGPVDCRSLIVASRSVARGRTVRQPRSGRIPRNARLGRGAGRSGGPPAARCGPPPGRSSPDVGAGGRRGHPRPRPPPASRRMPPAGPGTAAAGPDLEPDPPPPTRAATGAPPGPVRRPGRRLPREPVAATARRPGGPIGAEDLDGARETPVAALHPRRHQASLSSSTGTLLTRRDVERRVEGQGGDAAELVGNQKTLPRTKLLQQLKKRTTSAGPAFRVEEGDARAWSPAETMSAKLADRPMGGLGRARADRGAVRRRAWWRARRRSRCRG